MDKLKINDGKTEFMIVGTWTAVGEVNIDHLTIGDTRGNPVSELGLTRGVARIFQRGWGGLSLIHI